MIPSRPWLLQNRLVHAGALTKKTLYRALFPGTKSDPDGTARHHRFSLIWCNPGPCRTRLHGLSTVAGVRAGPMGA